MAKVSPRRITYIALFAAVLAVVSQVQLPLPGGVPVTVQVFIVALAGVVLGWRMGACAVLIYLLCGMVGLPVFAGFQGGMHVIVGPAGGYLMAWPLMTILCGIVVESGKDKADTIISVILALVGLAIVEGFGAFWWGSITGGNLRAILIYSFAAFIPKDIIITVFAILTGKKIRRMVNMRLD